MSTGFAGFDRVRPRRQQRVPAPPAATVDSEGKRALFSSAVETAPAGVGSALVECSRCDARTVLRPMQALRAALPSLHLGLRVGHRDDVRSLDVVKRDYPTYMRCPSCGRPSWVRFTLHL
jgi:uncharacterized C2H2 Zn-finger protein